MTTATLEPVAQDLAPRELARRRSGALDVFLLWHPADDAVTVRVEDLRTGVRVELDVEQSSAMRAFKHPFSYAP